MFLIKKTCILYYIFSASGSKDDADAAGGPAAAGNGNIFYFNMYPVS